MNKFYENLRGGESGYLAPELENVEVSVERGFAQSEGDVDYNTAWGDPSFYDGDYNDFNLD